MAKTKTKEKAFGISVTGPIKLQSDAEFLSGGGTAHSGINSRPYSNHAYVYACVRAIAQNIAQVPFIAQVGPQKSPKTVTVDDPGEIGDFVRTLESPNELMTKYQLWESTITHMNLTGSAVWVLDRSNVTEAPSNIWVFPPSNFIPVVIQQGHKLRVVSWAFISHTGEVIALPDFQVVLFKFYNPYDPIFGLAPLEAAARGIKFDYLASVYGANFFENSADPAGVITTERKLTAAQVTQFRESWEQRHRGAGNAKKVGILWGGMVYTPIPVSQKDMEFVAQREWTRDELLAVFKVPKTELGLYEDVNHATSMSQDRSFWMKTLIPISTNIQACITSRIVTGLRSSQPTLRCYFDTKTVPALQEQLSEKVANAEKLFKMGWPVNSINEKLQLGLPAVAWGDTWYVNQAIVPIDFVLDGKTLMQPKPSGQTVPGTDGEPPGDEKPPHNTPDDPTDDQGEGDKTFRTVLDRKRPLLLANKKPNAVAVLQRHSKSMKPILKTFLWKLRKEQLCTFVKNRTTFDKSEWSKKLSAKINPSISAFIREMGVDFLNVSEDNHPTLDHIADSVQPLLAGDIDGVRKLFNQVTGDAQLELLAQKELASAYRQAIRK